MRGQIQVKDPNAKAGEPPKTFTFDTVFGPNCKQVDVYNTVARPIVEKVLEGYNGKSHAIFTSLKFYLSGIAMIIAVVDVLNDFGNLH